MDSWVKEKLAKTGYTGVLVFDLINFISFAYVAYKLSKKASI